MMDEMVFVVLPSDVMEGVMLTALDSEDATELIDEKPEMSYHFFVAKLTTEGLL